MNTITPHAAKKIREGIREGFADLRSDIAQVRLLRKSDRVLAREEADGILDMAWNKHRSLQATMKQLRMARVVKFSNLSTSAAIRMTGVHARR